VEPLQLHGVERELRRKGRDGPDAVAARARALTVAARAEIPFTRRVHAVLAQPVAVVNEVAGGGRVLGGEIDVTTVAVAERPLVFVLVAAEARRHLREQRFRPRFGHRGMAADAVAFDRRHVLAMIEAEMRARELRCAAHERLTVTLSTRMLVVWFRVAPAAVGLRREVQMTGLVGARCARDPDVALHAIDPLRHVRTMLEGMGRVPSAKAEDPRAGRDRERQDHREGEKLHGSSRERATRASAFAS
jgi:hypothetical protein